MCERAGAGATVGGVWLDGLKFLPQEIRIREHSQWEYLLAPMTLDRLGPRNPVSLPLTLLTLWAIRHRTLPQLDWAEWGEPRLDSPS